MPNSKITHVVCTNLSGSKAEKHSKAGPKSSQVVHPDWIFACIDKNRRVPEFDFLLHRDVKSRSISQMLNVRHQFALSQASHSQSLTDIARNSASLVCGPQSMLSRDHAVTTVVKRQREQEQQAQAHVDHKWEQARNQKLHKRM
eukprot:TRINITY_DN7386_c0_g1_i3.p1 TRINITY_DN7386_c0_g1~~TRINITY_DN7386_c0_g1_i3.p1  ORF type:complete len:144 (+),score=9.16 TRINITY_DN7386_c0_g1_i3:299-730(+)